MIIIPAIDLKGGKCVRLRQGRMEDETIFSDDPAAVAMQWENLGAELIHVVDLDGAFKKVPQNLSAIERILDKVSVPIQVGGGIRTYDTAKLLLDRGVARIIIGTEAIRNPQLVKELCRVYPGRILLGIDAKNGFVAIEGWVKTTTVTAIDLAKSFEEDGVSAIIFTDIARDGMGTGPNLEQTQNLAESVNIPIIASGGVHTLQDIENLLRISHSGIEGVITGRAIYTGSLNLEQAIAVAQSQA